MMTHNANYDNKDNGDENANYSSDGSADHDDIFYNSDNVDGNNNDDENDNNNNDDVGEWKTVMRLYKDDEEDYDDHPWSEDMDWCCHHCPAP